MKQKLLKTMVLGLLAVGWTCGVRADNTVKYSTDGGSTWTEAADLNALNGDSQLFGTSTTDVQVQVSANQTLTSRITWKVAHKLTITPTANITIKGPAGAMWFLANVNNAAISIGSSDYSITLDGESKAHTSGDITRRENNAALTLTNITFKDFNLNSACHLVSCNGTGDATNGKVLLENITVTNCTNPSTAYIYSERVVNDILNLKGCLNIDESSTGTAIFTKLETKDSGTAGRIKVDDSSAALTATKTLTVTFTEASTTLVPKIGAAFIINSTNNWTDETMKVFALADNVAYGLFKNNKDLKLTQAYNLSVTSFGAATLVLPFASTIPTGASCYTLTHTAGSTKVSATGVGATTLSANTPVLVEAAEGSYKFVSTATSGDAATGSGTHTSGALTGVYTETTVPSGSYILYADGSHSIGFYKCDGSSQKVDANRAYLTAQSSNNAPLQIEMTTGIKSVTAQKEDGAVYNLQGVRVAHPTKGIYVKNGKKYIVK